MPSCPDILRLFIKVFAEHIGFSKETDDLDIWPKVSVVKQIVKKIKLKWPRLVVKKVGDEYVPTPLYSAIMRRFGDERQNYRNELKLPPKMKGIIHNGAISLRMSHL